MVVIDAPLSEEEKKTPCRTRKNINGENLNISDNLIKRSLLDVKLRKKISPNYRYFEVGNYSILTEVIRFLTLVQN